MDTNDVYGMTDKLEDTVLDAIATRLEVRGKHPFFMGALKEYLNIMQISSAKTVLDIGCGTGVATRVIAQTPGFSGKVTGIDLSTYLIKAANNLAKEEGLEGIVEFQSGDSQQLDIPDKSYDAVVLHTLVSHVADPVAVINEAARIVKPGGMVGIFDGDYATMTFGHEDLEQSKVFDDMISRALFTNPRIMRQMPRLIPDSGLDLVASFPYAIADIGKADFFMGAIESFRKLLPKAGVMSVEMAATWADMQMKDSDDGIFFGASNFYSYVAQRRMH